MESSLRSSERTLQNGKTHSLSEVNTTLLTKFSVVKCSAIRKLLILLRSESAYNFDFDNLFDMAHSKPKVNLLVLFVGQSAAPRLARFVNHPVEFVPFVVLADFDVVRE